MRTSFASIVALTAALLAPLLNVQSPGNGVLDAHVLLTWYGNPRSSRMGALGEQTGAARVGRLRASDINSALEVLERLIRAHDLPRKVLIVHQFRLDMLPDKSKVRPSALVDTALVMDGFGTQSLKLASYRAVMRQPLTFAGIKLFYQQDRNLFTPQQVLALTPAPSVVVYQ